MSRTPRLPDYFVARAYGVRSTVAMRYLLEQDTPWSFFGAAPAPRSGALEAEHVLSSSSERTRIQV